MNVKNLTNTKKCLTKAPIGVKFFAMKYQTKYQLLGGHAYGAHIRGGVDPIRPGAD